MKKHLIVLGAVAALAVPSMAQAKCRDKQFKKLKNGDIELLMAGLKADEEDCRGDAAKYLGDKIGDKEIKGDDAKNSLPVLQEVMLNDDSYGVRMDALRAIEEMFSSASLKTPALDVVQSAFERDDQEDSFFNKALSLLVKEDITRAQNGVIVHLSRYKKYDGPFLRSLLNAAEKLNDPAARDLPLLIVLDTGVKKPIRVKALDVLEAQNHPGLVDAYLAMLDDPDKKIQLRCIDGLSRSGLPPRKVQTALSNVVRTEKKGDVRARAMRGLKLYASPELLPLVHSQIVNEKHIMAWQHSFELLILLADQSSFGTVNQLLMRPWALQDGALITLMQTGLRLVIQADDASFGPMADQLIASITTRINFPEGEVGACGDGARAEGQRIIDLLTPHEPAAVVQVVETYVVPTYEEVVVIDLNADVEANYAYEMSVEVDAGGNVVSAGGSAFGFGASASVRVND